METSEISMDCCWGAAPALSLPQLEHLERVGVTVQCVGSSEFVVGKQTNFNGPVTIISCAEIWKERTRQEELTRELGRDKLVIRDEVLSPTAAMKMQKLAEGKQKQEEGGPEGVKAPVNLIKTHAFVFGGVFLLASAIALIVFFTAGFTGGESRPTCARLPNNACLYSGFWGGGPPTPEPSAPPVPYVIIFQTHDEYCYDVDTCLKFAEEFLGNGMESRKCNFLVGGDGNAYEGRGWREDAPSENPAPLPALRICFMGNFTDEDFPTYPQVGAAEALVRVALHKNFISEDYVVTASNATSPDDTLASIYSVIKKWPKFCPNPFANLPSRAPPSLITLSTENYQTKMAAA